MHLRWRLSVVTGAGAGLGREIALRLGRQGAAVLAVDLEAAAAEETAALVRESRVKAWSLAADVTDEADLRLVAARSRDLGAADLLVNNAGGWTPGDRQFPEADPTAWSRTLDLNLRAPMMLTQLFLAGLDGRRGRRGEPGAVVNVASEAATGTDGYGSPEYAAAKAGLVRLTTALARPDVARRARVCCVVPGWVGLPRAESQWAERRAALPAEDRDTLPPLVPPGEVAGTVVDLLRDGAAGTVVELVGGRPPRFLTPGA